jgi:signal transduction histidine kinase
MFGRARLTATALYVSTVLLIVIFFSLGLLVFFDLDLIGNVEIAPEGDHLNLPQEFEAATDRKLHLALAIVDPAIIVFSLVAGWFLAGRTLAPIQSNMKWQKRFVSDAAHELRTPLSIMKAGIDTIDAGAKPTVEDYRTLNDELLEEIDRMVSLSNDLLLLSRSELQIDSDKREIDISAICSKEFSAMQPYAGQMKVRIESDVTPGLRSWGNESQISRLVLNLLKNAIDYNREDGLVTLHLVKKGKKIVLSVTDTGIGISQQDLLHIFERFYKADDSRERSTSGSGLGLSIVDSIVAAHGGEIDIQSEPDVGTEVVVTLEALQPRIKTDSDG